MKRIVTLLLGGFLSLFAVSTACAESPQHFAIELKFGPYGPALDQTNGLNGATPYSDMFGDSSDPKGAAPSRGLLSLVEFDYQILNRFGILGVGIEGGYFSKTGPGFTNVNTPDNPQFCEVKSGNDSRTYWANGALLATPDRCFSGDENTFNIVPLALLATYRFDVLEKRFRIPIIPYLKLGLGYYIWWFGNSGSFVSQVDNKDSNNNSVRTSASGATPGFILKPGIAIDLSALDPSAARSLDNEIGLNRVTAFIEMNGAFMHGCSCSKPSLDLSDIMFTAGLGFEF